MSFVLPSHVYSFLAGAQQQWCETLQTLNANAEWILIVRAASETTNPATKR
jgi:hypothetical protein